MDTVRGYLWLHRVIALFLKSNKDNISEFDPMEAIRENPKGTVHCTGKLVVQM